MCLLPRVFSNVKISRAPALLTDRSSDPVSASFSRILAVSKLSFIVVAISPVGPRFAQPLQYSPAHTSKQSQDLRLLYLADSLRIYIVYFNCKVKENLILTP